MVCAHAASRCDALKYHKLSRVEQDRYKERRALMTPPVLAAWVAPSWRCADSQHSRGTGCSTGQTRKYTTRDRNTAVRLFFFFFGRRERIFVCSLNHVLVHSSSIPMFSPKGQADILLHQNRAEFLPSGEDLLCSSLKGVPSRLKYNHLFSFQWRWELWHPQAKGKEHPMWYEEECNDVPPFFQDGIANINPVLENASHRNTKSSIQ